MNSFWQNKRVLVTGATGFLGGWLCKELVEAGATVVGLTRKKETGLLQEHGILSKIELVKANITVQKSIQRAFQKTKPDYCFHLAGIAVPRLANRDPMQAILINVGGTLTVLGECALHSVPVILASSVRVYGDQKRVDETSSLLPLDVYACSKVLAEQVTVSLSKHAELKAGIARLATLYGPIRNDLTSHFVNNNIVKTMNNQEATNTKGYVRDFLFVQDAVHGLMALGEKVAKFSGEHFNFSSGQSFSGISLGKNIARLVQGKKASFKPLKWHCIKNSRAASFLHWKPRFSLKQGIKKTIEWHRQKGL